MPRHRLLLALLVAALTPVTLARPDTAPTLGLRAADSGYRAFTHARIVVSPTRRLDDATMIVRDGRVIRLGVGLPVPPGAFELDLKGKTIYPGFVDPYTEYGLSGVGPLNTKKTDLAPRYEGSGPGAVAWNDAIHAQRSWVESFEPDPLAAEALLERGVTVVQSSRMDGIFRGQAFVTSLAEGRARDLVLRPNSSAFASFDKGSSEQSYPSSQMGSIALVRQTLLDAGWYRRAHRAYGLNPGQQAPEHNRALDALAHEETPIVFETGDELSLLRAARIAEELDRPFVHVGSNREYRRIEEIAALSRPLILPLTFPRPPPVDSVEDGLDVALADLRHWERAPHNPAVLERHGVEFAFTGHGLGEKEDFLRNLRKAVRRGLGKQTALAAMTTVPARLCGLEHELGTLEVGKQANFLIAAGDLFEEPLPIYSVWIAGSLAKEVHSLDQIDFRGAYRLGLGGDAFRLKLSGKLSELRGRLEIEEDSVKLRSLSVEPTRLRAHAEIDRPRLSGVVRFEIAQIDGRLTGLAHLPDGRRLELELEKEPPGALDAEEDDDDAGNRVSETEDPRDLAPVSRLSFPNVAFGYERPPAGETVLVRNATIWTAEDDGILERADLLVEGGKISAIGFGLDAPRGARAIDGTGKHVTPGIIDEHSHLAISRGVNEGSHAVTAEVRIGDVVNPDDIGIYRALAGGVTTAQLLHGSANPIGGQAQIVKMRWGATAEGMKLEGAPPSIKFALGENVKQSNWGDHQKIRYPQTRMGVETVMKDAFNAALDHERERQAYERLGRRERERTVPPRRDLQLEALLEVLRSQRFVHCHSYVQGEILMMMRLAEELGFRIQTFTHILEGYKVAGEMAAHGATASTFSDWWAYKFEVYDAIPYNTCLLHDRGVVTSINSDSAEMIRRLNQEAAKSMMYCGMERTEAIKLATLNPAIQLRIDERVGSLRAGKDADFVIWNGDPLSVYSRVEQTWVDGANRFNLERDAELREAARRERLELVQKVLRAKDKSGSGRGTEREEPEWQCEDVEDAR